MDIKEISITYSKLLIHKRSISSLELKEAEDKSSLVMFIKNGKDITSMSLSNADIHILREFLNSREGKKWKYTLLL